MSTNQTPNYQLCQWEAEDKVLRTEFNADNAKIDAGIKAVDRRVDSLSSTVAGKASSSALAGLQSVVNGQAAAIAKLGNCAVHYAAFQGNGADRRTYTFDHRPVFAVLLDESTGRYMAIVRGAKQGFLLEYSGYEAVPVSWGAKSITIDSKTNGTITVLNNPSRTYHMVTFLDAEY